MQFATWESVAFGGDGDVLLQYAFRGDGKGEGARVGLGVTGSGSGLQWPRSISRRWTQMLADQMSTEGKGHHKDCDES